MKKTKQTPLHSLLEEHFVEDRLNHTDIKSRIDDYTERLEGISNNLNRLNNTIDEIKRMAQERDIKINTHIKRMEPMISEYEHQETTKNEIRSWGDNVLFISKIASATIFIIGVVVYIIKKFSN